MENFHSLNVCIEGLKPAFSNIDIIVATLAINRNIIFAVKRKLFLKSQLKNKRCY